MKVTKIDVVDTKNCQQCFDVTFQKLVVHINTHYYTMIKHYTSGSWTVMLQTNVVADRIAKLDCVWCKFQLHIQNLKYTKIGAMLAPYTQIHNNNNNLLNLIYTKLMPFSQHPHRHKHSLVAIATLESQSDQDLYCRTALTILYHRLRSQVQLYCFVASCDLLGDSLGT